MLRVPIVFSAFFLCYIVLAGEAKGEDVVMGGIAAALATVLVIAQRRTARFCFGWWLPPQKSLRLAAELGPQLWRVARCLLLALMCPRPAAAKGLPVSSAGEDAPNHYGAYLRQPYLQGADYADPREVSRNAWLTVLISILPQTFALRRDFEEALILHALPPREPSADAAWPL